MSKDDDFSRGQITAFFRSMDERLQLEVSTRTASTSTSSQPGGATRYEPFRTSHLARSLIKSGVPIEDVFEILSTVEADLGAYAYVATPIDRSELVRVVGQVLRKHSHKDRLEWVDAYHNRYGWAFESAHDRAPDGYVRTTDFEAIDGVIDRFFDKLEAERRSEVDSDHGPMRSHTREDRRSVILHTTRCIRATRLHTVSPSFVESVAREITTWALSPPKWTDQQRQAKLGQADEALNDAARLVTTGHLIDAESAIFRALALTVFVIQQRFGLWVGVVDDNLSALLERFLNRLAVAHDMNKAGERDGRHNHPFFDGAIFARLRESALKYEDFDAKLHRILDLIRALQRSQVTTDPSQGPDRRVDLLRRSLDGARTLANIAKGLTSDAEPCPTLQEYYRATGLASRQTILDKIVCSLLARAELPLLRDKAHNFTIRIPPKCPTLRQFGVATEMTFVCMASERGSSADDALAITPLAIVRRLEALPLDARRVVVVLSPHGFAPSHEDDTPAGHIILTLGPESIRELSVPGELCRLLESAAAELQRNVPFPPVAPTSLVETLTKATRLAAGLNFQEALHRLAVEFEAFLRDTIRGWLLAIWGAGYEKNLSDLLKRRDPRLDLGSFRTILGKDDKGFRKACCLWVERIAGVRVAEASLFPPELTTLLSAMAEIRNRSAHGAHGAKRLYNDEYIRFREMYERFIRLLLRLDYWPRLFRSRRAPHGAEGFVLFDSPGLTEPLPGEMPLLMVHADHVPADACAIYAFVRCWLRTEGAPEVVRCELWARTCPGCSGPQTVDRWRDSGVCQACASSSASVPAVNEPSALPKGPSRPPGEDGSSMDLGNSVTFREWFDWLSSNRARMEDIDAIVDRYGRLSEPFKSDNPRGRWRQFLRQVKQERGERRLVDMLRAPPALDPGPPTSRNEPSTGDREPGRPSGIAPRAGPRPPTRLVEAFQNDKVTLFVGSGLSLGSDVGGGFPTWSELPQRLLEELRDLEGLAPAAFEAERTRLTKKMKLRVRLAELGTLRSRLGRRYGDTMRAIFCPEHASPGAAHRAVAALKTPAVLTTNYDQLVEQADPMPSRQPYTWRHCTQALSLLEGGRRVLLKVHGSAELEDTIVMSEGEYDRTRADESYVAVMSYLLQSTTFLFIGYGMNDPLDLDLALAENARRFRGAARTHYVLLLGASEAEQERVASVYNVEVIGYDKHEDVVTFLRALESMRKLDPAAKRSAH